MPLRIGHVRRCYQRQSVLRAKSPPRIAAESKPAQRQMHEMSHRVAVRSSWSCGLGSSFTASGTFQYFDGVKRVRGITTAAGPEWLLSARQASTSSMAECTAASGMVRRARAQHGRRAVQTISAPDGCRPAGAFAAAASMGMSEGGPGAEASPAPRVIVNPAGWLRSRPVRG
jgi:hypothetical protein